MLRKLVLRPPALMTAAALSLPLFSCSGEDYPEPAGGATGFPSYGGQTTSGGTVGAGGTLSSGGAALGSGGKSAGGATVGAGGATVGAGGAKGGGFGAGGKTGGFGMGGKTGTGFGSGGKTGTGGSAFGAGGASAGGNSGSSASFSQVATILNTNCAKSGCHVAGGRSPNLTSTNLDALYTTLTTLMVCGGSFVSPNNPSASGLIKITSSAGCNGMKMPRSPNPPLSAANIQTITAWIQAGATK